MTNIHAESFIFIRITSGDSPLTTMKETPVGYTCMQIAQEKGEVKYHLKVDNEGLQRSLCNKFQSAANMKTKTNSPGF